MTQSYKKNNKGTYSKVIKANIFEARKHVAEAAKVIEYTKRFKHCVNE